MNTRRTIILVAAIALSASLSACGTPQGTTPPADAGESLPLPVASAPTEPVYRTGTIGEPFDIPGWWVTVTGQRCGPTAEVIRESMSTVVTTARACVVSLTAVNTTTVPAAFNPSDQANPFSVIGFDQAGNLFHAETWSLVNVNPKVTERGQQLMFGVADGETLTKAEINDVIVSLA